MCILSQTHVWIPVGDVCSNNNCLFTSATTDGNVPITSTFGKSVDRKERHSVKFVFLM